MESNVDTNLTHSSQVNERIIIKEIIINIRTHALDKALDIMYDYVGNEKIIKAIHDYLLGVNCKYPFIRYDKMITECGLYNVFISQLDFEMYSGSTTLSKCPCGSLVCTDWKYFTRTNKDVWTIAPMELFTNEYFQQGFLEKFQFCCHNKPCSHNKQ